jgi:hypothetical protein
LGGNFGMKAFRGDIGKPTDGGTSIEAALLNPKAIAILKIIF